MAEDAVKVTTFVAVPQARAFSVLTEQIDQWWRRGPRYRIAGRSPGTLHLEARLGGRIFEQLGDAGAPLHEVGRITAWQPPARFAFTWRSVTFAPGEETAVEVWFTPSGDGTRVTLEHSGWSTIRGDHPVRHARTGGDFLGNLGAWWGNLLTSLRELAEDDAQGG